MPIDVSVIVPTYNSGDGLNRLVASVDAQTLPADRFEVVFVDDGSTDDTHDRLLKIAAERPNVSVHRIPNSGWPSRPRNVGTREARGDYVLYMDHDDELFPEALERVAAFTREHRPDVVNAKEVRTQNWSWGWREFAENRPRISEDTIMSLLPMTPHKFYRRQFLLDNGIAFPEGRRVLWEDVYFNVAVGRHAEAVSVLADYPCYHWVKTSSNSSGSFGREPAELWGNVRRVMTTVAEEIEDPRDREALLRHWYNGRVLNFVGPAMLKRPHAHATESIGLAQTLVADLIPESMDVGLNPAAAARAVLLRRGDADSLFELAHYDQGVHAYPHLDELRWQDGALSFTAHAVLTGPEASPLLVQDGDRYLRALPERLRNLLPADLLDVTDAVAEATFEAGVRGRYSRCAWQIPSEGSVEVVAGESGGLVLRGSESAVIDVGVLKVPSDERVWDVSARLTALGYLQHRGVRTGALRASAALVDGRAVVAYRNKSDLLSLDVDAAVRSLVSSSHPRPEHVTLTGEPDRRLEIAISLPAMHVRGETEEPGWLHVGDLRFPAVLRAGSEGAQVEGWAIVPAGRYPLTPDFFGRKGKPGLALVVDDYGSASVVAA